MSEPRSQPSPRRQNQRLHHGRLSNQGAAYFITLVTRSRQAWLSDAIARDTLLTAFQRWHDENDGRVLCATVMPDHAHVLVELGRHHTIGRLVARWKAEVTRSVGLDTPWQRDFWEHRLRDEESVEDYGLYVLLNPYRAKLCAADAPWPGWWLASPEVFRFAQALAGEGVPPVEWQGWGEERFAGLATRSNPDCG
ncbi:MAG: transposase [Verrucomicrobiota bacterium]